MAPQRIAVHGCDNKQQGLVGDVSRVVLQLQQIYEIYAIIRTIEENAEKQACYEDQDQHGPSGPAQVLLALILTDHLFFSFFSVFCWQLEGVSRVGGDDRQMEGKEGCE